MAHHNHTHHHHSSSHHHHHSGHRRHKSRVLTVVLVTLLLLVAALVGGGEYFLSYALSRPATPYDVDKEIAELKADYPWTASWVDSLRAKGAMRDTFITNDRGVRLHAWLIASAKGSMKKTAVVVHGYTSNPIEMMQIGYLYHHDMGWNVILPDLEAHGQSDGKSINMGWNDRLDVERWAEIGHERFEADTMVVHGISMGAATTMCVAGDATPSYIVGFVEDCGYTSVWDEFSGELKKQFGLPAFPLLHVTSMLCKLQKGWSFTQASPIDQVGKCHKPMLFIHGTADDYVPTAMVHPLYQAKPPKKQLWLAEGAAHAEAYKDHHEEYTRRVKSFIDAL